METADCATMEHHYKISSEESNHPHQICAGATALDNMKEEEHTQTCSFLLYSNNIVLDQSPVFWFTECKYIE